MADKATEIAPQLKEYRFPSHYPHEFMTSEDTLWLRLTPRSFRPDITVQSGANQTAPSNTSLYFLLPKSFAFGIDHQWKDLTTVSGAIREVKIGIELAAAQLSAFAGTSFANPYGAGQSKKNDNPYIYESSSRRKLQLELKFGAKYDAEQEVWNPIQSLMLWSSADKTGGQYDTTINFPYVFKLQSVNGKGEEVGLIHMENACIEQITPTYEEPYRKGFPMSASCSVSFTDIDPLYRSTMSAAGKSRIRAGVE